jgi:membrane-bound lytic murein transglycosylase F
LKKLIIITFILIAGLSSCHSIGGKKNQAQKLKVAQKAKGSELKRIKEVDELKVVVDYNSTNYFVYKGQPMGFQYELLKAFAEDLGVDLHLFVSNNLEETFEGLNSSEYDLVAKNLTVTKDRNRIVDFTEPLALTRQVLVQRKADGFEGMSESEVEESLIREQLQLANKTVHVQKNTVFVQRLKHLSEEIGEPIHIVEDTIYGVEQLIARVASGEIEYTVCDENVGLVNQKYYPWIDVNTPVSFNQKLSWAVRKNSPEWKAYIDEWIIDFKKTSQYRQIYNKYFSGNRSSRIVRSEYHSITGGKVSEFDDLIREISSAFGWDWRLIAAIIMQESGFNQYAESWVGAMGLMQLMPQTASQYNVDDIIDPRENIRAGLEYLTWLDEVFQPIISDKDERLKFVLASYNVGIGHVMDARKLAMKYGKDPSVWKDNVDIFILKKSIPGFYRDPVVKWGYCRGEEPYNYVIKVLDRYGHYLNVLPDENNVALVSLPVLQESWR